MNGCCVEALLPMMVNANRANTSGISSASARRLELGNQDLRSHGTGLGRMQGTGPSGHSISRGTPIPITKGSPHFSSSCAQWKSHGPAHPATHR